MPQEYYSNGKLLLTGEYAVLDGARGLAVPTRFGQALAVEKAEGDILHWTAWDEKHQVWFQTAFRLTKKGPEETRSNPKNDDPEIRKRLLEILRKARGLNPDFLPSGAGLKVETHLNFPREWGLGTSSTLVNNIAQWAGIDAYALLFGTIGGSGYDIACARNDHPITFRLEQGKPIVSSAAFSPPFRGQLHFIYLNQKRDTRQAVNEYRDRKFDRGELVRTINDLTDRMISCGELDEFCSILDTHEGLMGSALGIRPIKEREFADFRGSIKSLGAWGGDFVLAAGGIDTPAYFRTRGYETVIPYGQMVLS